MEFNWSEMGIRERLWAQYIWVIINKNNETIIKHWDDIKETVRYSPKHDIVYFPSINNFSEVHADGSETIRRLKELGQEPETLDNA